MPVTAETLTFSGIAVYQPEFPPRNYRRQSAPETPARRRDCAVQGVSGERYDGNWVDVGAPQRLQELDRRLNENPG